MTMPNERTRSLRWAFELLELLTTDPTLTDLDRAEAFSISRSYPSPQRVVQMMTDDVPILPCEVATAMARARRLFDGLLFSGHGSAETRHLLLYTLRHQPELETIQHMARFPHLRDWLRPEGHYR